MFPEMNTKNSNRWNKRFKWYLKLKYTHKYYSVLKKKMYPHLLFISIFQECSFTQIVTLKNKLSLSKRHTTRLNIILLVHVTLWLVTWISNWGNSESWDYKIKAHEFFNQLYTGGRYQNSAILIILGTNNVTQI